ncbi:MAG TPA: ribosome recycling factor [Lentimicrobium sp.]|jgi:ribosome recycling factor|nr:ribosome recycling factor [Lentimicrobium sp.]
MNEEVRFILDEAEESMQNALVHLEKEFHKIRAGKASPAMLEGVRVDYYGTMSPLDQISNINTPDPRQIIVQPWEKSMLAPIEKAIMAANLGFNPQNNGEVLRIIVPPLTEERRKDLVKKVKAEVENAKVTVRNMRRSALDSGKKLEKEGVPEDEIKQLEKEIQQLTDKYIEKVDKLFELKEKDIMTV